jgi:murein tripeptide amidase MpaA
MVKIDRPARRLNETIFFRSPVCKEEEIMELMVKFNIESFSILPPPTSIPSMRRSLLTAVDKIDQNFLLPVEQFDFDVISRRYLSCLEIDAYLSKVAEFVNKKNPNIEVSVKDEGVTFEKRPIKSIKIAYRGKSNPIVVIDAGIHAREWHSRSLALYSIRKLMDEALLDQNGMIFRTTFIVIPNANPDGYSFSKNVVRFDKKLIIFL